MPTAVSDWPVLETGLCRLRPARQSDLSALKAAVMDSRFPTELNLAKMAREGRLGEWLTGLLGQAHPPRLWSITASDADDCIGQVALIPIENAGAHWVSYWLAPSFWGRGIATAAVTALADAALAQPTYRQLVAMIAPENPASVAVALHAGFVGASGEDCPVPAIAGFDAFVRQRTDHESA
jgi:RimJ/RimL family protein N-acetyltransferase